MDKDSHRIRNQAVDEYLPEVYTEYAMSVITDRAIPDVRDGLKPVQRRILYSMWTQNLTPDSQHKKSARTVGEVLGKYHPHGDRAVYDALARMAQDFTLRYPLVDGQGNFGSIDGDPPAAMRYTEARLTELAEEFFQRLKPAGSGVDWQDNFDGSTTEPEALPVPFPNVIVNGASGIAVGMSTDIPPHNLEEILEATIHLIDHPNAHYSTLLEEVQGPDFPTGGVVFAEKEELEELYESGSGRIQIAGRCHIEQISPERGAIVIEELPYNVPKSRLIDQMVDLAKSDKDPGISTVRDESDRQGLRVVVECRLKKNPEVILNNLYEETSLKKQQRCSFLVLNDGVPVVMPLREMLNRYNQFAEEVLIRNTKKRKEKAEDRLHIVRGLLKALIDIDRVIEIVKQSDTGPKASVALQHEFEMSEPQAEAVLDRRIRSLTGLEQIEIEKEKEQLLEDIEYYENLLNSEKERGNVLKKWYRTIRDTYGDQRRTSIEHEELELEADDLRENKPVTVSIYPNNYLRRDHKDKAIEDLPVPPRQFIHTRSLDEFLVFGRQGTVYSFRASEIPTDFRDERGAPLQQINSNIKEVAGVVPGRAREVYVFTRNGYVKKMEIEGNENLTDIRPSGIKYINFKEENNEVIQALPGRKAANIVAVAQNGKGLKFEADELRTMSRNARGVIARKGEAKLAGAALCRPGEYLLLQGGNTCAALAVDDIPTQNRGGKGRYLIKPSNGDKLEHVTVSSNPRAARKGKITEFSSRSQLAGHGAREDIDYFIVETNWTEEETEGPTQQELQLS
ncbi:MAG: DNA gyrase/topoisomerase IV subunit A [bacterium]